MEVISSLPEFDCLYCVRLLVAPWRECIHSDSLFYVLCSFKKILTMFHRLYFILLGRVQEDTVHSIRCHSLKGSPKYNSLDSVL